MSDLVIHNIDDKLIKELEQNANAHGLTAAEEARRIIHLALTRDRELKRFKAEADDFARKVGPQTIDSTDIIREERDHL